MRVVEETRRLLVVEIQGWIVRGMFFAIVLLHLATLSLVLSPARPLQMVLTLMASLLAYTIGWHLVMGKWSDKLVVRMDGSKHIVRIERHWPHGKVDGETIHFDSIEQFELSPPIDRGVCRVKLRDGRRRSLFRIGMRDDYEPLKHLDMITRKPLEIL